MKAGNALLTASLCLSLCGSVSAQATLNFSLLGYNGSLMERAHVALMDGPDLLLVVQIGEDSKYSLELPKPGGYRLYAMGPHHETLKIPLIAEENGPVDLSIRLAPRYLSHELDSVWVVTADSSGTHRHLMERLSDGIYSAQVPTTSDPLAFQISASTRSGSAVVLAGTHHDKLLLDEAGPFWDAASDYYSIKKNSGGIVEISFDPSRLPEHEAQAVIETDPPVHALILAEDLFVDKQSQLETSAFWALQRGEISEQDYESRLDDLQTPVRKRIDNLEDGLLRQWLMLRYFHSLMPAAKDSLLARQVLEKVAPTSALWSYFTSRALDASLLIRTINYRAGDSKQVLSYLRQVIDNHTDPEVRSQFLLAGITMAHDLGDESLKWEYYLQLQGDYAESPQAEHARKDFSPERALQPGKTIPSFSFSALGDESQTYTDELLRGTVFLLDFWGTWCAGSYAQLPELHEAYRKHHDAGFEILSMAMMDNKESMAEFRQDQFPMPWLHSLVASEDYEATVQSFEVSAFPWPILVNREGTIVALGRDLLKSDLSEVLDEVLDTEP